jgi:hypothetical protein
MSNQKISELTQTTTPLLADLVPLVDGGVTKYALLSDLRKVMEWDIHITKAIDTDVTNTTTVADDSELQISMTTGDAWYVELLLVYSASSAATDYRLNFAFPTAEGYLRGQGLSTTNTAQATSAALAGVSATTDITLGTLATVTARRMAMFDMAFLVGATSTFKVQSANSTAGVGNISRTCIGTILRAKKVL